MIKGKQSNLPKISFVVFFRDVGIDLQNTLDAIRHACKSLKLVKYQIVVVDDGSKTDFNYMNITSDLIFIRHSENKGISAAIVSGLQKVENEWCLPVPGHNMFGPEAIANVIELCGHGDLVLGCRSNLARTRPPVKRLASRILRDVYRHLTFYFVGDVHGLLLARTSDFKRFLTHDSGHGNAIKVITGVLAEGGTLVQTLAPVQDGHSKRVSRKFSDLYPSLRATGSTLTALVQARRVYKALK